MSRDIHLVLQAVSSSQIDPLESRDDCAHSHLPTVQEFYGNVTPALASLIAVATLAVVLTCVTCACSMVHVLTKTPPRFRGHTAWVLTVHPAAAILAYVSVLVPRASFLVSMGMHNLYGLCLYQLFCLMAAHCQDEDSVDPLRGAQIKLDLGDLFWLLGRVPVLISRTSLLRQRYLVLQLPVMMWIIYTVRFVLWSEDKELVRTVWPYMEPLQLVSMIVAGGVVRMLSDLVGGATTRQKMNAIKATMLLAKLQGPAVHRLARLLPCMGAFSPHFWSHIAVNVVCLLQYLFLSVWANRLFCGDATQFDRLREEPMEDELEAACALTDGPAPPSGPLVDPGPTGDSKKPLISHVSLVGIA
ncbi:uncharacterized protein LOC126210501 [Schistocerca nitens]|uniref:uncharacterized protein LOC126210501 n=1 Tax=Schistocerca nitens TaxID=7011 RepID=UPI002117DFB5|nr:uncharacterized protein LOC126210501 [Schistocerca nitens]